MTTKSDPSRIAAAFDRSHSGRMQSATVDRIYRAAFGADYPQAAQPNAFYSRTTLERLARALQVGPGHTVADLGCGHGGPSVWVARQTGASLIGVDLSPVGIDLARRRAAESGLSTQVRFEVGDVAATGLPDASCDAAMSLDVFPFVPDKAAALREVARILRLGGRFAFTTWEQIEPAVMQPHPLLGTADNAEYHPLEHHHLLDETGLAVDTYEEPPGWRRQQQALAEGIMANEVELTQDMGAHYPAMARNFLANLGSMRYLFIVARRSLHAP